MSWLGSWFGRKPSKEPEETAEDVLGKETASAQQILDTLKLKRMKQLQEGNRLQTQAKAAFDRGDRAAATQLLKQKSVIDTRVRQMNGQIHNMNQQQMAMESAAVSAQMARTMKQGTGEMERVVNSVDIDEIGDIASTLAQLADETFEMSDVLATPIGDAYMPEDVDELVEDQLAQWSQPQPEKRPGIQVNTQPQPQREPQTEPQISTETLLEELEKPRYRVPAKALDPVI